MELIIQPSIHRLGSETSLVASQVCQAPWRSPNLRSSESGNDGGTNHLWNMRRFMRTNIEQYLFPIGGSVLQNELIGNDALQNHISMY